jgi:hypothetical protein
MTDYLTLAEVLAIHDDHIERYGGSTGVREPPACSKPPFSGPRRAITPT